jgi:hypothetical protein
MHVLSCTTQFVHPGMEHLVVYCICNNCWTRLRLTMGQMLMLFFLSCFMVTIFMALLSFMLHDRETHP